MIINVENTAANKPSKYFDMSVGVIIAIGIFIRCVQFLANRSLWKDEAMLALNIVNRSFAQLSQPLDYNQGAPLAFLWVEKIAGLIFGYKDFALRLFPFIAGCISVWLMYSLAKKIVLPPTAVFITALFSFSSYLIYYSSELKQYSVDIAIVLLLFLLASPLLSGKFSKQQILLLGSVGAIALWFSHPAIFVLGGVSLGLILLYYFKKDFTSLSYIGVMIVVWLATFGLLYVLSLRHLTVNHYLVNYWHNYFLPIYPSIDLAWFPQVFKTIFIESIGITSIFYVQGLLCIIGTVFLVIRKWQWGIPFLATIFLNLVASAIHKYPFGGRLFLYAVPLFFIFIGMGLEIIFLVLKRNPIFSFGIWLVLALFLLFEPLTSSLNILQKPIAREEIKPIIEYLKGHYREKDVVYIYYGAIYPLQYYAPFYGLDMNDFVIGSEFRDTPQKYEAEIKKLRGHKRVWFVFLHFFSDDGVDEKAVFFSGLNRMGKIKERFNAPRASVFLYDLRHDS
jgi:hypothetical protein